MSGHLSAGLNHRIHERAEHRRLRRQYLAVDVLLGNRQGAPPYGTAKWDGD